MFQLDLKSRKSIYEQVVDNIKELIITGVLAPQEKLPSVRDLSREITINPNTVQKAYRELEHQGYVYTVSGLGTFVSLPQDRPVDEKKLSSLKEELNSCIKELLYLGVSPENIRKMADDILKERGDNA
ncbi:MAG: GntR family transcriptional regulator [Clostridiales bacterium]|nr:GntR family transcriptional regulator [Clostridiales bacterium]